MRSLADQAASTKVCTHPTLLLLRGAITRTTGYALIRISTLQRCVDEFHPLSLSLLLLPCPSLGVARECIAVPGSSKRRKACRRLVRLVHKSSSHRVIESVDWDIDCGSLKGTAFARISRGHMGASGGVVGGRGDRN